MRSWQKFEGPFLRSFLAASSGSSSRQHQENHAENTNETVTHFNRWYFNHCHQQFPNFNENMVIWCDKVAQELFQNTSPAVHIYEFFK